MKYMGFIFKTNKYFKVEGLGLKSKMRFPKLNFSTDLGRHIKVPRIEERIKINQKETAC